MTAAEIRRCREDLAQLRRQAANVRRGDIERLVLKLGYVLKPKKGGHPVYVKQGRLPITIPGHQRLNTNTVRAILERLEQELDREEEDIQHGDRRDP
jgi:predicted RNA binding protein YcfA (HicA-like mRNA interferase family)